MANLSSYLIQAPKNSYIFGCLIASIVIHSLIKSYITLDSKYYDFTIFTPTTDFLQNALYTLQYHPYPI